MIATIMKPEQNISINDAIKLASIKFNQGAYAEAEGICNAILNINPNHPDANHVLGVIAFRVGKFDIAINLFEKAIKHNKKNAEYLTNLGNAYKEVGELDKAIRCFKKSIAINSGFAKTHYNLANVYFEQNDFQKAAHFYQQAARLNPNYAEALNNLAVIHRETGDYQKARELFNRAIELNPKYAMAMNNLGVTLAKAGDHAEALEVYHKAIAIRPGYAEAWYNLGNLYDKLGNLVEARRCYEKALQLNGNIAEAENNLGVICTELQEYDNAIKHLSRAIDIDPKYKFSYLNYGNLFRKVGMYEDAVSMYKKAIDIDPKFTDAYYNIGCVYSDEEHSEEAIAYFNKTIALNPAYAPAYKNLGNVHKDFGRLEEARRLFRKAIEINPAFTEAYRELVSVQKLAAEDEELQRMLQLYASDKLNTQQRMHLAFGLGTVYENLSEPAKAFDYFAEANHLRRQLFPYYPAQVEQTFEKIRQLFTPEFVESLQAYGLDDVTPIYILGMPRSGSSLVEQILASHSQVYGAGELNYTAKLVNERCSLPKKLDYPDCVADIDATMVRQLASDYLAQIRAKSADARYITDKMPQNFFYVGLIKILFPNARIIHTTRDPMDNCWSIYKHGFYDGHAYADDLQDLGHYYNLYRELMNHWATFPGNSILDVNYEDLVADQEAQTRRLLDYCDLPWEDACLSFYKTQRKVHTASATQVRQGIYKDSLARWKRYEQQLQPLKQILDNV